MAMTYGQVDAADQYSTRPLNYTEAISRQIDRINYLRSYGHDWSEALYSLRDMVTGREDDTFEQAWERITPDTYTYEGHTIYIPRPEHLSEQYRCLLNLLQRLRITWTTRNQSRIGPLPTPANNTADTPPEP